MRSIRQSFAAPGSWWLDVKLGIRLLLKHPGLALTGGAGIAVAVAIAAGSFSVIHGNLRASSLPLAEGERIVSLELWNTLARKVEQRTLYDFHRWREELQSVQEISAFRTTTPNLTLPGAPAESVRVAAISASGFRAARVRPLLGRYLAEADERPGAQPVIVIGEKVWRNRFASDPAILGRTIQLGAALHTVAGVMPDGFAFPVNHHFWIPLRAGIAPPEPLTGPDLTIFGRLAPDATPVSAQAEVAAIGQRTAKAFPRIYAELRPQVIPYALAIAGLHGREDVTGLAAMQGLLLGLLVLVCLNVAILVYARAAARQDEISLRTALGAGRSRIVAQFFLEALVLSVAAAAAGVAIAAFALRQVTTATEHIGPDLPFWISFRISPEAVLYAGLLSVVSAAIVGIVPGLQATGRQAHSGIRIVGAGDSGMRLGTIWTILIVAQTAFAVALLPPAVSKAVETLAAGMAGPGFAAHEFLSAELGMNSATEPGPDVFTGRQTELMRRLEGEPRVARVTFALAHPGDERGARIEAEAAPGMIHDVRFNLVDVHFFRTFGVPILAGRDLAPADVAPANPGEPPQGAFVVVNQALAQRIFGGNALGRRIRYAAGNSRTARVNSEPGRWYEIAGIIPNFPTGVSPGMRDSELKMYHPVAAGQVQPAAIALRMRSGAPITFSQHLREITASVDPDLHLRQIASLDEFLRREQWIVRLEAAALAGVTVSVLLLSSAGIYALMSFTVSRRRKDIGIRMALGASRERILAGIFSRALRQVGAGAALGAASGIALETASGGNLMHGNAPAVVVPVALAMMAVGLLAALGPARKCLRIEPTETLREQ